MATQWLRRRGWLLAAGASVLLAACGGGEVESKLSPTRIVAFGDAMADIGQKASGQRYTVNDNSINNWTVVVARSFGLALGPQRTGGTSYAAGNARVTATPGAGNDPAAPSVTQQISAFLAARSFTETDLVLVSAGTSDVIVQAQAAIAGTQTADQMAANLRQAGTELGNQVRRLVTAGARFVVVAGPYNLERSPWAKQTSQQALLKRASSTFNTALLLAIEDLGENVLYIDAAQQFNVYEANPGSFSFDNVTTPVCTSIDSADADEGIGTGAGQVDSSECQPPADVRVAEYDKFLFADQVYPTPRGHRLLGEHAFDRVRNRW